MPTDVQLGRTRLYSFHVALTCLTCGEPIFTERARSRIEPDWNLIVCPACACAMRVDVSLRKESEE